MLTPTNTGTNTASYEGAYGLLAEFDQPEPLLRAVHAVREAGYRDVDAFTPMPVEGLAEAIGFRRTLIERFVLVAGVLGATGGFTLCWWMSVVAYPHIVGGRPLNSWPAYVPITFESMVLIASLTAVIGMLVLNGLPQPYHPVFNVAQFERASRDRFFLCIESTDPMFDPTATLEFMESLGALEVFHVDR